MQVIKEFREFLQEYKVIGLAVAFIIGAATTSLVQSLVNDIIMPLVGILLPKGDWQQVTVPVGPALLKIGSFISALLNFIILAAVVFIIVEKVMGSEKTKK